MARPKSEHPAQVMSARVPYDLAQLTRKEAAALGVRVSARIRDGLRAIAGRGSSDFEKKATKELVRAAEKGTIAAVADVAGELLALAPNKKEAAFVEQTATHIAEALSAAIQKTHKEDQTKAAKVAKPKGRPPTTGPGTKPYAETMKGQDIAAAFKKAKSKAEISRLAAQFTEDADSPREMMFIEKESKAAIRAAERALARQQKEQAIKQRQQEEKAKKAIKSGQAARESMAAMRQGRAATIAQRKAARESAHIPAVVLASYQMPWRRPDWWQENEGERIREALALAKIWSDPKAAQKYSAAQIQEADIVYQRQNAFEELWGTPKWERLVQELKPSVLTMAETPKELAAFKKHLLEGATSPAKKAAIEKAAKAHQKTLTQARGPGRPRKVPQLPGPRALLGLPHLPAKPTIKTKVKTGAAARGGVQTLKASTHKKAAALPEVLGRASSMLEAGIPKHTVAKMVARELDTDQAEARILTDNLTAAKTAPKADPRIVDIYTKGKEGAIQTTAPLGSSLKTILELAKEQTKLALDRRGSKGPYEVQTSLGIYKRPDGGVFFNAKRELFPDIDFKTWEQLEADERELPTMAGPQLGPTSARNPRTLAAARQMRETARDQQEKKELAERPPDWQPTSGIETSEERTLREFANAHELTGVLDEFKARDLALAALHSRGEDNPNLTKKERLERAKRHSDLMSYHFTVTSDNEETRRDHRNMGKRHKAYWLAWQAFAALPKKKALELPAKLSQLEALRQKIQTAKTQGGLNQISHTINLYKFTPDEDMSLIRAVVARREELENIKGYPGKTKEEAAELRAQSKARAIETREKQKAESAAGRRAPPKKKLHTLKPSPEYYGVLNQAKAMLEAGVKPAKVAAEVAKELHVAPSMAARLTRELAPKEEPAEACEGAGCEYALQGGKCSVKAPLVVGAKEGGVFSAPARFCLIELDKLKPSHNSLRSYSRTPGYPIAAQERDYEHERGEQAKVQTIADNYEPSLVFNNAPGAIDGLPVANEQGVVLGGNGRTMATALVYGGHAKNATADTIKKYLKAHIREFGFTEKQLAEFNKPMIVRTVRTGTDDAQELAQWSRRLNQSMSQALNPTLIAVSRARFLDPDALSELASLPDDETINAWLSSNASRGFVRSLEKSGVIDTRNSPTFLLPGGLLSPAGRDLVQDLLVAVLIPDADLIKALGPGTTATLAKSAPYLAQLAALKQYNVLPEFTLALRDLVSLRAQGFTDVPRFLEQRGMFGVDSKVRGNPIAEVWLFILLELQASPAKLAKLARYYLGLAKAPSSGQAGLFAAETFTPQQALERAAKVAGVKL